LKRLQIQTVTADDASLIASISRETFYDSFAEQNTVADMQLFLDTQFTTEKLIAEVLDPANIFFIAYVDDQPAGYCKMRPGAHIQMHTTEKVIEISRFYARKNSIGKGIGKAMMQHALKYAQQQLYKKIWLGVWEKNERAIAFYQSFRFSKFGEHDFLLGTDLQRDWLMMKDLTF
jgi:diamine N-acetyltransferase